MQTSLSPMLPYRILFRANGVQAAIWHHALTNTSLTCCPRLFLDPAFIQDLAFRVQGPAFGALVSGRLGEGGATVISTQYNHNIPFK